MHRYCYVLPLRENQNPALIAALLFLDFLCFCIHCFLDCFPEQLHFSSVQLFGAVWTLASQVPLPKRFSRQEYWSGLPFPSPENLPDPGIKPRSPALQVGSLPLAIDVKWWRLTTRRLRSTVFTTTCQEILTHRWLWKDQWNRVSLGTNERAVTQYSV